MNRLCITRVVSCIIVLITLLTGTTLLASNSEGNRNSQSTYEITITNITRGQTFTPILAASHQHGIRIFSVGQPATAELALLAESGNTVPLAERLRSTAGVEEVTTADEPLPPGKSVTLQVSAIQADHVSVAAMLIPTNDTFFALNGVEAPLSEGSMSVHRSPGYDAGSEPNDELCANIPGPVCEGQGESTDVDGEGYVFIQQGIHGIGDLRPAERDWRNPVAQIVIRRIKQ